MYSSNTVAAMNNLNYVKAILLLYPLAFAIIRSNISGILDYQLNRSAMKKRKKGETVKEWFLYSRFREEIPKAILVLYFAILCHASCGNAGVLYCIPCKFSGDRQRDRILYAFFQRGMDIRSLFAVPTG